MNTENRAAFKAAAKRAQVICDRAQDEGRGFTDSEQEQVNAALA
jgi:hypothetical protein